jgi:hypothetical protein
MEYLFIYCLQLFDKIDTLNWFTGITIIVSTFLLALGFIMSNDQYIEDVGTKLVEISRKILIGTIILHCLINLIPTKQTLLLMGGIYLGKKAVNQVVTSQKLEKVNTIIDLQLDKYIKELKGVAK